ncbi:hypothetical protein ACFV3R_02655 [Streptomyces sp. NPDC059740]|uniref:hypothetical protein n=1 Tax=Streptomyces sp. NPDC059740 TaxID=3346926 RepID=UPI00364B0D09
MDGGTAAVVGALVGGVSGLGGSLLALIGQRLQQRAQARADRARWRDDARREAYTKFLDCLERLSAQWWTTADLMRTDPGAAELREERYSRAHELWTELTAAVGAVSVAGPREVTQVLEPLLDAVSNLDEVGTDWRDALRAGRQLELGRCADRFDAALAGLQAPRAAFRQAAREALSTDS